MDVHGTVQWKLYVVGMLWCAGCTFTAPQDCPDERPWSEAEQACRAASAEDMFSAPTDLDEMAKDASAFDASAPDVSPPADMGSSCEAGLQDYDGDGRCMPSCGPQSCRARESCDDSSGLVVCACEEGQSCPSACAAGFERVDGLPYCTKPCPASSPACARGGECVQVLSIDGAGLQEACLRCDEGYAGLEQGEGNMCTECARGYVKGLAAGECVKPAAQPVCQPACSGVKVCVLNGQQQPVCACPEGQQDDNADGQCNPTCASQFPDEACSGHGSCVISMAPAVTSGKPVCVCDTGYASSVGSDDCRVCATGYVRNADASTCERP